MTAFSCHILLVLCGLSRMFCSHIGLHARKWVLLLIIMFIHTELHFIITGILKECHLLFATNPTKVLVLLLVLATKSWSWFLALKSLLTSLTSSVAYDLSWIIFVHRRKTMTAMFDLNTQVRSQDEDDLISRLRPGGSCHGNRNCPTAVLLTYSYPVYTTKHIWSKHEANI